MHVKEIINEARFKLHDTDEARFSDYDILAALNEALRVYRELCEAEAPEIIERLEIGIVPGGWHLIDVPSGCRVLELRIEGSVVSPSRYRLARVQSKMCIVLDEENPSDRRYELKLMEGPARLAHDSNIDAIEDFRGYFVDFTVNILNGGDAEQQAAIKERLRDKLHAYTPCPHFVSGYY